MRWQTRSYEPGEVIAGDIVRAYPLYRAIHEHDGDLPLFVFAKDGQGCGGGLGVRPEHQPGDLVIQQLPQYPRFVIAIARIAEDDLIAGRPQLGLGAVENIGVDLVVEAASEVTDGARRLVLLPLIDDEGAAARRASDQAFDFEPLGGDAHGRPG